MKFQPGLFLLLIGFASCSGENDKPGNIPPVDTPEVVAYDSSDFLIDTIITEDGKQVIVTHDCSVLKKRIPPDSALEQLQYDLDELSFCVDSFDFKYVIPNLLASWMSEERVKGNNSITYGDFVKHLNEFKTSEAYAQLHEQVMTLDSLRALPFEVNKLQLMRATFGKLGMTEPEWNAFSGFARTYPVPENAKTIFTWGDMMDAFESYYNQYNETH